jgi:adenylate kinase
LREWLKKRNFSIDKVILLEVSGDVSVRRLSARRTCEQCGKLYNLITNPPPNSDFCECGGKLVQRDDDKPETIKKRLITYKSETEPLIKLFEEEGILLRVNGERPVNEIFEEIIAKIKGDDGNVTNTS